MIGPLLLALSWLLLRFEGRSLSDLGLDRPRRRTLEFLAGLALAAGFAAAQQLLNSALADFEWQINPLMDAARWRENLRFNINSVLFEELVFRGYLLFQAIRFLGPRWACALSAAAFGIYHWFSYGALGNPVLMVYLFVLTGSFGLMLAYAFARTGSILLPIGLHLGWNLVTITVFSRGPLGEQWLLASDPTAALGPWESVLVSLVLPLSLPLLVLFLLWRRAVGNKASGRQKPGGQHGA